MIWHLASIIASATSGKEFVDPIGQGEYMPRVGQHGMTVGKGLPNICLDMLDCLLLTSAFSESSNKNVKL